MSGNGFSRRPLWRAAALIGGSLLWPACAMEQPVVVPPDPESNSPLVTNAPPHSASFTSDPPPAERPPLGTETPPPDATLPLPVVAISPDASRRHDLFERIPSQGRLPVIVQLEIGAAPPGAAPDDSETSQQDMIAATQQQVIERLLRATGTSRDRLAIKTFSLTPALGLQVDQRELRELLTYPEVSDIVEDAAAPPLDR